MTNKINKTNKKNRKNIHLPTYIKPTKYNLILRPDLDTFVFDGKEIIEVLVERNVKSITLHSKDIDIETAQISYKTKNKKQTQFAQKVTYDIKNETATIYWKDIIPKGRAKISLIFSGIISDKLRGFYKSKYILEGKEKYLATTQFEATDARRAFPCFDEPRYKAVFTVKLIIPKNHTAISNTLPINIKEHDASYKIVSFSPTPKMSTYLLAFIVGDLEYIEKKIKLSGKDTLIRVFTVKGKKRQAKFALDVAIKSIRFYNKYFGIPYPLSTLDLIAIPDFESGAMENWGAITFRESAILIDEKNSSLLNKQWVAIVIAHELAHQWFGNLVTMHWWTDLWLNEGFASFMENFCIDNLFPEWKVWNLFLANRYSAALGLDSLYNSHPIEVEVGHPSEINEIFDMVSYSKGSAIIKMLSAYLGEEQFRSGLQYYLKKHSYKNAKTINLWESFEKISGKPVKKIMKSWTKQTGYPLITLERNLSGFTLKQERFLSSRICRENSKEKNIWKIPIFYKDKAVLITKENTKIKEKEIGKINRKEISFIRVKYDNKTLNLFKEDIISGKLEPIDRLAIIRDLFALAEGGYIETSTVLEFSLVYKNETEYIVWAEIIKGLNKIKNLIKGESYEDKFNKYVINLLKPVCEKVGWNKKEKEKSRDVFLRNLVLFSSGLYGNKKIIEVAKKKFIRKNQTQIESDLRGTIYSIFANSIHKDKGSKEWEELIKLYKKETLQEEKERYAYALSQFQNKELLKRTLEFALSPDVRNQDAPALIIHVWRNPNGRDLTWQFI